MKEVTGIYRLNIESDGYLYLYGEITENGFKFDHFVYSWYSWDDFFSFIENLMPDTFDAVKHLHVSVTPMKESH